MKAGGQRAWETLAGLDPDDVCRRSGARHDAGTGAYRLALYGQVVVVSVPDRVITGGSAETELLLGRLGYFSILSILTYLATAQPMPPSGRLVKPADMRGGDIYYRGSHVLPLDGIASVYGADAGAFRARGRRFGGAAADHGDAALRFRPFHNLELELILWLADDEFPARADLLFDSAVDAQLPADIVWSVAMMTVLMMMP